MIVDPIATGVAPRSAHVPLDRTTQPRYPDGVGRPDAPHLVLAVGHAPSVGVRAQDRLRVLDDVATAGAVLDAELPALTTGWRLLAVGTERDGQAIRAAALARGALDEEVTVLALDVDEIEGVRVRRLFCGHCHHRFDARAAVGDAVGCPGCGVELAVAGHHSRRLGAFLGVPRC